MTRAVEHELHSAEKTASEAFRGAIARLPRTMQPGLNQKLDNWGNLFPFERRQLTNFLEGLAQLRPAQLDELVQPLRDLEEKMGVAQWNFSTVADTVENASLLARSRYFVEWRHEVERIFAAIESAAQKQTMLAAAGRLILLVLPESLPVASIAEQAPWDSRGKEFALAGDAGTVCALALRREGLRAAPAVQDEADCWLVDAGDTLGGLLPAQHQPVQLLEYTALKNFRDRFLAQLNTMPKDIESADHVLARMRNQDWTPLWPAMLAGQERLRNFVVDLFFSGNGALIFSNAFVEWAASEALRRARPRVMVCRFGMRSKLKPFTSIAVFENQQTISALRDEDDPRGSAVDALILARYVWLAAMRYPEGEQTSLVCVVESRRSVYLITPENRRPEWWHDRATSPEKIAEWMRQISLA